MIRITEETEDEVEFEISLIADIIGLVFSVDYFKNIGLSVVNDESIVYADSSKTEGQREKTEGEVEKTEGEVEKTEGEVEKTEGEVQEKSLQEGDELYEPKEPTSLATALSEPGETSSSSQPPVTAHDESKESLQEGNDMVRNEPETVRNEPERVKTGTVKTGTVKNDWEKPIQLGGKNSKRKRRGGVGSKHELTFPYKYIEMFIDNTRKAFSKTFSSAPSKKSQETKETKKEEEEKETTAVGETKSNIFSRMFEHPKTLEIKQENINVEKPSGENPSGEPLEKSATGNIESEKKGIFSFEQPHTLENKTPLEESSIKPLDESSIKPLEDRTVASLEEPATEDVAPVFEENSSIPKKGLFKTETPKTLEEKKDNYSEKQKQGLFQINEPKTIEQKLTEPSVTNSPDVLEQNANSVPNSAVTTENTASTHNEKGDSALLQGVDGNQTTAKTAVTSSYSIFDNIKMFLGFESKPQSTNVSAGESHYKTAVVRIYKKGAVLTKPQYDEERKADSKNPELIDVSPEDGQTDLQREKIADDEKIQKENKERILSTLSSEERYEMKVKYDAISVQGDLVFYVYADAAALLHKEPTKIDFTLSL